MGKIFAFPWNKDLFFGEEEGRLGRFEGLHMHYSQNFSLLLRSFFSHFPPFLLFYYSKSSRIPYLAQIWQSSSPLVSLLRLSDVLRFFFFKNFVLVLQSPFHPPHHPLLDAYFTELASAIPAILLGPIALFLSFSFSLSPQFQSCFPKPLSCCHLIAPASSPQRTSSITHSDFYGNCSTILYFYWALLPHYFSPVSGDPRVLEFFL